MLRSFFISLSFVWIFIFSSSALAIVNGNEIQTSDKSVYVGLDFQIKGVAGVDPCSGTYLGNGAFLTAAHCFLLNEYATEELTICIYDIKKTNKVCVTNNDFEVSFPPVLEWGGKAPTRKRRTVIKIPKPDIAVLKLKKEFAEKINFLNTVTVSTAVNEPSEQLFVVGQGCTNYASFGEEVLGQGVFRTANVEITVPKSEIEWTSLWTPTNTNGGVCWGDSGGALMSTHNGQLVQRGVVSAMKTKHDPATGNAAVVTSFYGRLDNSTIRQWLSEILAN